MPKGPRLTQWSAAAGATLCQARAYGRRGVKGLARGEAGAPLRLSHTQYRWAGGLLSPPYATLAR
eukprot:2993479-Prymnesium_polylepis.1